MRDRASGLGWRGEAKDVADVQAQFAAAQGAASWAAWVDSRNGYVDADIDEFPDTDVAGLDDYLAALSKTQEAARVAVAAEKLAAEVASLEAVK